MYFYASTAGGGAMMLPYPVEREEQAIVKTLVRPANDAQAARGLEPLYQTVQKQNRS